MTYLASFTMEKALVNSRLYLAVKFLFDNRFSKILWRFLRLLGYKRIVRLHFVGGVSGQGDMQRGSFQMCKGSRHVVYHISYQPWLGSI